MSIILIGGMDRLERHYQNEANERGINLKIFTKPKKEVVKKIGKVDAIVIFTDKVGHSLKSEVTNYARAKGIPCFMYHSCGVVTLRKCLDCIKIRKKEGKV